MKVEIELLFTIGGICFVAGFCFGAAFTKYLMKDILRKYKMIFGKIDHPLIHIL